MNVQNARQVFAVVIAMFVTSSPFRRFVVFNFLMQIYRWSDGLDMIWRNRKIVPKYKMPQKMMEEQTTTYSTGHCFMRCGVTPMPFSI